jgi:hypothetical protein
VRKAYNILVVKPEGKRPFGKLGVNTADNIRMDLREIVRDVVDWINLA